MGRVYEQIPHPKIAYAYLAFEAETWNEFEKLRSEGLKKHPLYGPSAFEQPREALKRSLDVVAAEVAAEAAAGEPVPAPSGEAVSSAAEQASAATAPTEGLSPRDKAKAAMAKKGA